MRVWNEISPRRLCRKHLLGEHVEIHSLWAIYEKGSNGYRNHPETKRWRDNRKRLALRHNLLADEMRRRGYNHKSPLLLDGLPVTDLYLGEDPPAWDDQEAALALKAANGCDCQSDRRKRLPAG